VLFEDKDEVALMKFNTEITCHPGDPESFPNIHLQCEFGSDKLQIMNVVDKTHPTEKKDEFLGALCVALTIIKARITAARKAEPKK
jgi:hypothetical protein